MCIILACKDKLPTDDELQTSAALNPDGAGVAWIGKTGLVEWQKGLSLHDVKTILPHVPLPCVIHFRIATSGGVSKELCHPFPVSKKVSVEESGRAKQVLFHNGIWSDWQAHLLTGVTSHRRRVPGGPWSDTRAMAYLAFLYGTDFLKIFDDKIAVLSKERVRLFGRR